jgi:hypothetical protein
MDADGFVGVKAALASEAFIGAVLALAHCRCNCKLEI